jgi:hypothetical protein
MFRSLFGSSPAQSRFEACNDFEALRLVIAKLVAKRDELHKAIVPDTFGSVEENKCSILTDIINAIYIHIDQFNSSAGNYRPEVELKYMIHLVSQLTPIILNAYQDKETSAILNQFRNNTHEQISTAIDVGGYVATGAAVLFAPVSILPKFLVFFGSRAVAENINPKIKENIGIETQYTKSMQILLELYNTLAQLNTNLAEAYKRVAPAQPPAPNKYYSHK